jgi:hypothetical protein
MAGQTDEDAFDGAVTLLTDRLAALRRQGNWAAIVSLGDEAVARLQKRLDAKQRASIDASVKEAREKRREADRQRVAALVRQLRTGDEAAREDARAQLRRMNGRAVGPLIRELRAVVTSDSADPAAEKAIIAVLRQIAPKLGDYDPAAPREARVKAIDTWLQRVDG